MPAVIGGLESRPTLSFIHGTVLISKIYSFPDRILDNILLS